MLLTWCDTLDALLQFLSRGKCYALGLCVGVSNVLMSNSMQRVARCDSRC